MQYRRAKSRPKLLFLYPSHPQSRSFLCEPENLDLLRDCFKRVMNKHPFKIDAIVILPNHLHCLWILRIK
jgi:putative transposase